MRAGASVAAMALAWSVWASAIARQAPFIARTDLVTANVSVEQGHVPVPGLQASDFRVFDDTAPERVLTVAVDAVPIDATLFLDTSGGTAGALPEMIAAVRRISQRLRPGDRFRVLTIGYSVYEAIPWRDAGAQVDLQPVFVEGISLIRDAVALAVRHRVGVGRRHVVIALTDGEDECSIVRPDALIAEASRSDAVVHWIRMGTPVRGNTPSPFAYCAESPELDTGWLQTIAERTGGQKHSSLLGSDPVTAFDKVLDDFRSSYVVTFAPTPAPHPGWHTLRVTVPGKSYTIRARAGYDGGR